MKKNVLIIAPHPDDEVLGCGGTINKMAADGHDVFVLIATRGSSNLYDQSKVENVRSEARRAHQILGVSQTFFLDFPSPELDTVSIAEISREFSKIIMQLSVDILFVPHRGDIHNDHRVVFNAAIVAARPVGDCPVSEIYSYETVSETEWAAPFANDSFIPTLFIDITANLERKLDSMNCFSSQIREFPNPRSVKNIKALASFRGATVGLFASEAFMTIRRIIK